MGVEFPILGDKIAAKRIAKEHRVPLVPGTDYALENLAEAQEKALEIGFPLLIKAAMGGGGKGMRVVRDATELKEQMPLAIGEAKAAFGDGSVFLERYIEQPRHIEIQILADRQGNVLHLFERDCSIQRRHQKVVEESPAQGLKQETREALTGC
jgi:acetyl/propionyl-CoA carboxylase alpha subunit